MMRLNLYTEALRAEQRSAAKKETCRRASAKYYRANSEKIIANVRAWEEKNHGRAVLNERRAAQTYRLKKLGLTHADFESMLAAQHGVCAVCGQTETLSFGRLAVDHDHYTGEVRGLLCTACNKGIGQFCDSPSRLRAAAEYLERTK